MSSAEVQALKKQEDNMAFTVCGKLRDVTVTDPDMGRTVQADVLVFDGSSERVLTLAPVLEEGDCRGCLIGIDTAWELFGSTEVTGDKICVGNSMRTIRGVMKLPESGVVCVNPQDINGVKGDDEEKDETPYYDRITIDSPNTADAEAFLMQSNLNGKELRMDYLKDLCWLTELVPGKWSDFSGWKENIKRKKQDFTLLSQVQKNSIELCCENQCRQYLWYRALEAACVLAALVCGKNVRFFLHFRVRKKER